MSTPEDEARRVGWHEDPTDPAVERWWNGVSWSADSRPSPAAPAWAPAPDPSLVWPRPAPPDGPVQPVPPTVAPRPVSATTPPMALAGLVTGVAGFFVLPVILGPLAIVLGARAPRMPGGRRHGFATAAMVIGAVDIGARVIFFVGALLAR